MISIIDNLHTHLGADSPSSHRECLRQGFENLGVPVRVGNLGSNKNVACWGWRKGQKLRETGLEVLVLERGYIGNRFHYTSLGWNGLNGHAEFPEYPDDGGERFRAHGGVLEDWKYDGDYILILGQVANDASLQGKNLDEWYSYIGRKASERFGKPVYFRPHPDAVRRGGYYRVNGIPNMGGTLDEALEGALFTIAFNSNSCLDSVLKGIPCFAGDKGTMAWDLCMHDLTKIVRPRREEVVNRIAWTQWSPDEMKSGKALVKIVERMKQCEQLL